MAFKNLVQKIKSKSTKTKVKIIFPKRPSISLTLQKKTLSTFNLVLKLSSFFKLIPFSKSRQGGNNTTIEELELQTISASNWNRRRYIDYEKTFTRFSGVVKLYLYYIHTVFVCACASYTIYCTLTLLLVGAKSEKIDVLLVSRIIPTAVASISLFDSISMLFCSSNEIIFVLSEMAMHSSRAQNGNNPGSKSRTVWFGTVEAVVFILGVGSIYSCFPAQTYGPFTVALNLFVESYIFFVNSLNTVRFVYVTLAIVLVTKIQLKELSDASKTGKNTGKRILEYREMLLFNKYSNTICKRNLPFLVSFFVILEILVVVVTLTKFHTLPFLLYLVFPLVTIVIMLIIFVGFSEIATVGSTSPKNLVKLKSSFLRCNTNRKMLDVQYRCIRKTMASFSSIKFDLGCLGIITVSTPALMVHTIISCLLIIFEK